MLRLRYGAIKPSLRLAVGLAGAEQPGAGPWNSEEGMRAALAALVPVDVATSE